MRFYYDTEFIEGFAKPIPFLPSIGKFNRPIWQIQLISIGIVCDDGREYYAICREFDPSTASEWVRENVLKKVYDELVEMAGGMGEDPVYSDDNLKFLLRWHGKSKKEIAQEIRQFVYEPMVKEWLGDSDTAITAWLKENNIWLYGYYADYDHVLFSTLFGTMMDLPTGFPMYTRDLKQTLDDMCKVLDITPEELQKGKFYPKQANEHNALADARWNLELHNYLKTQAALYRQ